MADERRYRDDEVTEIFDRASRGGEVRRDRGVDEQGLTLAELQDVGREVGIDPQRIAESAAALDRPATVLPERRMWGRPLSVGRSVDLPRAPTDHEWEQLVAELRLTFGSKGVAASDGNLREWSVGNLHALVEPTADGYRLRLQTLKSSAIASRSMGTIMLGFGAFMGAIIMARGGWDDLVVPLVFAAMGAAALVWPLLALPSWAREREQQMQHVAERARALLTE